MITRQQKRNQNENLKTEALQSEQTINVGITDDEESRINSLVTAAVTTQQTQLFSELKQQMTTFIQSSLETTFRNFSAQNSSISTPNFETIPKVLGLVVVVEQLVSAIDILGCGVVAAISPIVGIISILLSTTVPEGVFCNAIGSAADVRRGLTVAVVVVVVATAVTVAVVVAATALVPGKVDVGVLPAMLNIIIKYVTIAFIPETQTAYIKLLSAGCGYGLVVYYADASNYSAYDAFALSEDAIQLFREHVTLLIGPVPSSNAAQHSK
uniref:Uncharacterized protein n=1 Tax=Glossina pallidipes TaxID=7398 RepID=A0A1A9ZZT7_GLOPL